MLQGVDRFDAASGVGDRTQRPAVAATLGSNLGPRCAARHRRGVSFPVVAGRGTISVSGVPIGRARASLETSPMEELIREVLAQLGEDPEREGLQRTPRRVAEALRTLTRGYAQNVETLLNGAVFTEKYNEMVIVKHIDFYSLCEHHLLPFYGKCHVAYIPDGRIVGLSKVPRIVEMFARRLQVQERLTQEIADCLERVLTPKGVAVVCDAYHLCMAMRGVEKQNAHAVTSAMTGVFLKDYRTRDEFMELIR
jgi:GTP cyclohydrolase I